MEPDEDVDLDPHVLYIIMYVENIPVPTVYNSSKVIGDLCITAYSQGTDTGA